MEGKLNLKNTRYTIDRFEGDIAVLENRENGEILNIDRKKLPSDAKEMDILKYADGKFEIDKEETKNVKQRIEGKADRLWK